MIWYLQLLRLTGPGEPLRLVVLLSILLLDFVTNHYVLQFCGVWRLDRDDLVLSVRPAAMGLFLQPLLNGVGLAAIDQDVLWLPTLLIVGLGLFDLWRLRLDDDPRRLLLLGMRSSIRRA